MYQKPCKESYGQVVYVGYVVYEAVYGFSRGIGGKLNVEALVPIKQ